MNNVTISMNDLTGAVEAMVAENVRENKDAFNRNVRSAGRHAVSELKSTSPTRSGGYASGWKASSKTGSEGLVSVTVHNAKKPGLTHLLEKGHAKWLWGRPTGGRVRAFPHIAPAYESAVKELLP